MALMPFGAALTFRTHPEQDAGAAEGGAGLQACMKQHSLRKAALACPTNPLCIRARLQPRRKQL